MSPWVLYLVSDLLFASAFVALYFALRSTNRTAMLVGVALNSLFVILDVALDIPLRLSLITLGDSYSAAQTSAQQASVSAAAQAIMNASNLVALVATAVQFSAVIIASSIMLKSGSFKRSISYLGVACGVIAILFIPAFVGGGAQLAGLFNIGGFALLVVWSVGRAPGFESLKPSHTQRGPQAPRRAPRHRKPFLKPAPAVHDAVTYRLPF